MKTKQSGYLHHIQQAQQQNLSLADYARQHGLSVQRLYAARYTAHKATRKTSSAFVPAQLSPTATVRVVLPNGVAIHVTELTGDLIRLFAALPCLI